MILQRSGDYCGGRCRSVIDQHDNRLGMGKIAGPRIIAFDIGLLASALRNDFAALEKRIRNFDRLIEQAARIGPERSEERRGGKECVSTCRSRRTPYH